MQSEVSCPIFGPQWGLVHRRCALLGFEVRRRLGLGGAEVLATMSAGRARFGVEARFWASKRAEKIRESYC